MNKDLIAKCFDEWAKRYAADPASFDEILDANGNVIEGYGESSAHYFLSLIEEFE